MPIRWATTSGNWSNLAIWNDSASLGFPTASDDIFTNSFNVNVDQSFTVNSLNNAARARDIATPAMTANNAPSPYVASTSEGSAFAWNAFNQNITGTNNAQISSASGWYKIDTLNGFVLDAYTIYGSDVQSFNPRNWTIEGSNNDSTWTTVHTVTLGAAIGGNGSYSSPSIGNTTSYRYYRMNISLNGGSTTTIRVADIFYHALGTAALASGGSFIFNSGSISGSATSTTAALTAGATNLIQVTATTGSVGLTLGSSVTAPAVASSNLILHSGNCNFNLTGLNFFANGSANAAVCINKSSTGTITVIGNIFNATAASNAIGLSSTNGNTVIIGNVTAQGNTGGNSHGISQTAGNVTVTGNVFGNLTGATSPNNGINLTGANSILTIAGNIVGGSSPSVGVNLTGAASQLIVIGNVTGGTGTSAHGINFTGASGSITGTVTGGAGTTARGINTTNALSVTGNVIGGAGVGAEGVINTSGITTVIGNVTGGANGWGIGANSTNAINVTGTVTAASGINTGGVYQTGGGVVNLTGNMINVSGRQAIFSQNLFISNTATSQWRLFTQGGQDKTLYSADTFPNQPTSANVRSGSLFGPANALSGSMVVPLPSDVRVNVLTDNTVGTGQSLTAADFLAAISSSADPFAQRLRNVATVDTVGSLVTGLNGGF